MARQVAMAGAEDQMITEQLGKRVDTGRVGPVRMRHSYVKSANGTQQLVFHRSIGLVCVFDGDGDTFDLAVWHGGGRACCHEEKEPGESLGERIPQGGEEYT